MTNTEQATAGALLGAYSLDGQGGGRRLDWDDIQGANFTAGLTWIHLYLPDPYTGTYVRDESGLDESVSDVLLAEHTRPRLLHLDEGVLVILRGINFNPGAEPDESGSATGRTAAPRRGQGVLARGARPGLVARDRGPDHPLPGGA